MNSQGGSQRSKACARVIRSVHIMISMHWKIVDLRNGSRSR